MASLGKETLEDVQVENEEGKEGNPDDPNGSFLKLFYFFSIKKNFSIILFKH